MILSTADYRPNQADGLLFALAEPMTNALGIVWKVEESQSSLPRAADPKRVEAGERRALPTHNGLAAGTATIPLVRPDGTDQADALAPLLLTSPLLLSANTTQVCQLCDFGKLLRLDEGQTIYRNGDEAACVYIVIDGIIEVQSAYGKFREAGELAGEFAILSNARRFGSARATSVATLLEVPSSLLRRFFRTGRSALEGVHPVLVEELATAALEQFGLGKSLGLKSLTRLAAACVLQSFACGDFIDEPGTDRDGIYVVVSGRLSSTEAYGQYEVAAENLCEGVAFRLASRTPAKTLRAHSDGWLLRLDRQEVSDILVLSPDARKKFIGYV